MLSIRSCRITHINLILCLLFAAQSAASALQVGETYQQVIAQKGEPKSRVVDGATAVLIYPDASVELSNNVVVAVTSRVSKAQPASPPSPPSPPTPTRSDLITALQKEFNEAKASVLKIVNQPVQSLNRTPGMKVATYPDWFHEGAMTPNFNDVDIRKTQQFDYDRFPYVALSSRPGTVYVGSQLEFNSMTKLFYTDRSLPKKKLTEPEMVEINRLYRIIGKNERQLNQLAAIGR